MKKPEKFDTFIYVMRRKACSWGLIELMNDYDINEDELDECEKYLSMLQKLDSVDA